MSNHPVQEKSLGLYVIVFLILVYYDSFIPTKVGLTPLVEEEFH